MGGFIQKLFDRISRVFTVHQPTPTSPAWSRVNKWEWLMLLYLFPGEVFLKVPLNSLLLTSVFHFQGIDQLSLPVCVTGPTGPQSPGEAFLLAARSGVSYLGGRRRVIQTGREGRGRRATARGGVHVFNQGPHSLWQQAPSLGQWNLCHMIFITTSLIAVIPAWSDTGDKY